MNRNGCGEEVLRWEDAVVCVADLADFATGLLATTPQIGEADEVGAEADVLLQVQQTVLPDRFEALAQRRLTNDWGHHFVSYAAFALETRELLLQVARLRRR